MKTQGNDMQVAKHGPDRRVILSTLWIFYLFNILYADVLSLMGAAPSADAAELIEKLTTPEMLLVAAIFLEMAMVMIVLSLVLKHVANRWMNIVVALLHALGVVASLFVGTPTRFYVFFVVVEVATLLFIAWYAWTWADDFTSGGTDAGRYG
jgi:hypothetical protein